MSEKTISILDGSTFLVSSPNGDIDASPDQPHGLFYQDMRHLSKWRLTIQGDDKAMLTMKQSVDRVLMARAALGEEELAA